MLERSPLFRKCSPLFFKKLQSSCLPQSSALIPFLDLLNRHTNSIAFIHDSRSIPVLSSSRAISFHDPLETTAMQSH
jgi:hypothetical protein